MYNDIALLKPRGKCLIPNTCSDTASAIARVSAMFMGTCASMWISEHIKNWVGDKPTSKLTSKPICSFQDYIQGKKGTAEELSEERVDKLSTEYVEEYGVVFAVLDSEFIGGKYRQSRAWVEALKINGHADGAKLSYEKAILRKCEESLRSCFGYNTTKYSKQMYAILIRSIGLSMEKCRLSDDDEKDKTLRGLFFDHWGILVRQTEDVFPEYDSLV